MQNKWALVTGADRGVGLGLVKVLIARGYHVFAGQFIPNNGELEQLSELSGERLRLLPLDISDEASVSSAVEAVDAVTDRLDMLINNGAILGDIKASIQDDLNFEEMERVFKVNTLGSLRMSNGLIESIMRSDSKLIVNISSEAGSIGSCWRTGWYAYCMSKAALNMQSQLIHNQIAGQGGKVMVIHPGHVQTYMQGKLDTAGALTPLESAEHILGLVENRLRPDYSGDKLELIDYAGNTLPW
ncbi:SDR family oxidoreductase [Paenibacillus puerhi]|uniref:SDR family oxidoreductase n=1 Tax=Paenibacillus puerhi TaxID=2692622 RepID=UPI0013585EE8|nr:SDR family oxidoreductase [Paenibacillus puerhi]